MSIPIADFAFLNDTPAGTHGFVQAREGRLIFDDGTPARFFGVNLSFDAAFPDAGTARRIADDLYHSGCNMVRFHHVDSARGRSLIDYNAGDTQHLSQENFRRLDYLASLLKERGIYLHLDMYTLRRFLPQDGFSPDEAQRLTAPVKSLLYYDEKLLALHVSFAEKYLSHVNAYTQVAYKDEPQVAVVQFLNENAIFWDTGDPRPDSILALLGGRFNAYLADRYGSRAALAEAWTHHGQCELQADEDPFEGTVAQPPVGVWGERKYDPAGEGLASPARHRDFTQFLAQTQRRVFAGFYARLRRMGVKCAINCSNLPNGAAELYCAQLGDVTEHNAYWNHPEGGFRPPARFHRHAIYDLDPRAPKPTFTMNHPACACAWAKTAEKPMIVTEFNALYPTPYRGDALLQMAAYGCLQGWDGILLFCYSETSGPDYTHPDGMNGFFSSVHDPALWGMFPLAAAIFRLGLVSPGRTRIEVGVCPEDWTRCPGDYAALTTALAPVCRVAVRFFDHAIRSSADAVVACGFFPSGDYTGLPRAILGAPSGQAWLDRHPNAYRCAGRPGWADVQAAMVDWGLWGRDTGWAGGAVRSDTGEITLDIDRHFFRLEAGRVAAYAGRRGAGRHAFPFEMALAEGSWCALAMDGLPLGQSTCILLAGIGRCENTGMVWDGDTLCDAGHGPIRQELLEGTLTLPYPFTVTDSSGRVLKAQPSPQGRHALTLAGSQAYLIRR